MLAVPSSLNNNLNGPEQMYNKQIMKIKIKR